MAVVVALLGAGGTAYGLLRDDGTAVRTAAPSGEADDTTTSTSEGATTTAPPTTTTSAPPPPPPPPSDGILRRGAAGPEVEALQRRLVELSFDPGPVDGRFGLATLYAVQGFQKLNDLAPDGAVGPDVRKALESPKAAAPLVPAGGGERVEIDLRRQLLFLYEGGRLDLVTHVSTGSNERYCVDGDCNIADTPPGSYRFLWRYPGWRQSRLGKLYNPVYFMRNGIAVHGSQSVPTYPASHGCIRIPMHIAEYFPSRVNEGDEVYVVDGATPVAPAPAPPPPTPPPADPPTSPEAAPPEPPAPPTTTTTTAPPPPAPTTTAPPVAATVAPPPGPAPP